MWNTTYKGIIDDDFLKGLSDNEKQSAERIKKSISEQPDYYVLVLQNKIIGWVYYTLNSDKYKSTAEIHSLYISKEYQGRGYGKLLYNYVVENILNKGIKKLIIGCLDGNPSNHFYRHIGGKNI